MDYSEIRAGETDYWEIRVDETDTSGEDGAHVQVDSKWLESIEVDRHL